MPLSGEGRKEAMSIHTDASMLRSNIPKPSSKTESSIVSGGKSLNMEPTATRSEAEATELDEAARAYGNSTA